MFVVVFQTAITVSLDDLQEFDPDLATAVQNNTRSYTKLISDIVSDMLPSLKDRDVRCVPYSVFLS
jgi:DNA replicative helicase MCM subunit Mcm2 (Cdc46/Mcm family)